MKTTATRRLSLGLLALSTLFAPVAAQDDLESRELTGIVEEQAQVVRQLQRLRGTMEVLLKRLDAEGRTRTAELLREAITMLDSRTATEEGERPATIEERMERAREMLKSGQLVQSLNSQQALVQELERLLSVLLDRKNLEALEEKIAELKALQEAIDALADQEAKLREETNALREQASNETQESLEASLDALIERERELLKRNEELGRASGTLELEQLERELSLLLRDQRTDAAVLEAWDPRQEAGLELARADLSEAQRAEEQAARLERAAQSLRQGAQQAESSPSPTTDPADAERLEAAQADLVREQQEADLAAQASRDAAARRAAEALARGIEELEQAGQGETSPGEAAETLRAEARALEDAATRARAAAAESRRKADESLAELSRSESAAGQAAQNVQEWLEEARAAAQEGERAGAKEATDRAMGQLEAERADLAMLGEAVSNSQAEQARGTERAGRQLQTMPQAGTPSGEQAAQALSEAAEAMKDASAAARNRTPGAARENARRAEKALERALESLGSSRSEASRSQADASRALAEEQAALGEEASELDALVPEASMSPEAQGEVEGALQEARQAMERAAGELSQGRSSSAAGSQREALQAMRRARQAAEKGVTPQSASDERRAEELAKEQERIREELLDLARRIDERDNARPMPNMESASEAAQEAQDQLQGGNLSEAGQKEREVEQELRQTKQRLEEEEEQYQRLREEEQLFRIAEEIAGMLDTHRTQMQELLEIDGQRPPDSAPSRAQRLRLRRISREEESLGNRALEMSTAIREEGSTVSGRLLENVSDDFLRIAEALSESGDFETGGRTQALQRDVEESLGWLLDALRDEQMRRKEEQKQGQQDQQPPPGENKPGLVPDTAELKLLRRMEIDVQESVSLLLQIHPDLAEDVDDLDPRVLRDISRLALRHEAVTELFKEMRERLGIPVADQPVPADPEN